MEREKLMPKVLFIRVSAETYDENQVPKTWPLLFNTVWPDADLEGVADPKTLVRKLVGDRKRGALELAREFADLASFETLPDGADKALLRQKAQELETALHALEESLGNRDVRGASASCDALESALDAVEIALRK
jgi:hypothetical protein